MASVVSDAAEALDLCPLHHLYLKPISRLTVSVALPHLKLPGKSISNWEVMERLKAMVQPEQFSALRISKSTMDFIRFEGEVETRSSVKRILSRLEGKSIKLSGFTDTLKVRTAENKVDFPTRHDWDSFFRDAKDMNETVPGERPDTVRLEGLPCKWFAQQDGSPDRPSEAVLKTVFERFGQIRNVDIPMLDPYREDMSGNHFSTFSFGGHLNFEAFVQYVDHTGFLKAMEALRGMKLLFRGDDGKAVACSIKVTFDTTKHLSESSLKKRQQERQKLQELEKQREEQKRREKEDEERRKEEERKQREQEEQEKERRREEKLRRREQKLKEKEEKKNQKKLRKQQEEEQKKMKKQQEEEQKKLQLKIQMEERKLLLAQRNLQSIRLLAELLSRAKLEREREQQVECVRLQQLQQRRREQEQELRRVEQEKSRALELQRRERELRQRLLDNLLKNNTHTHTDADTHGDTHALKEDQQQSKTQQKKTRAERSRRSRSRTHSHTHTQHTLTRSRRQRSTHSHGQSSSRSRSRSRSTSRGRRRHTHTTRKN